MRARVLTALWYAPLFLALAWLGPPWFTGLVALAALVGGWEFYRLRQVPRDLAGVGMFFTLLFVISPHLGQLQSLPLFLVAAGALALGVGLRHRPWMGRGGWGDAIGGVIYTGWLLSFWVTLRGREGGMGWALFGLLVVFTFDTMAFFTGRRWGRHRLAPRISPGKTWEGAAGGMAAAVAAAIPLSLLLSLPLTILPLALALSLAAQAGDLFESSLKRSAGVKDSGTLLPGHGGVLDRIDGLLLAGPVLYYGVIWLA